MLPLTRSPHKAHRRLLREDPSPGLRDGRGSPGRRGAGESSVRPGLGVGRAWRVGGMGGRAAWLRTGQGGIPSLRPSAPILRSARGVQRRWVEHDAAQSEHLLSGQGQGLGPRPSGRPEPARLVRPRELRGAPAGPSAWPWARRFSPDSRLQVQRPCEGRVRVSSSVCPLLFSAFRCLFPPPP